MCIPATLIATIALFSDDLYTSIGLRSENTKFSINHQSSRKN